MGSNEKDVEAVVKNAISETLGISTNDIDMELDIEKEMNADSLDYVEISMWVEEDLDIEIQDEDLDQLKTGMDFVRICNKIIGRA